MVLAGTEGFLFEEPEVERNSVLDVFRAVFAQGITGADYGLLRVISGLRCGKQLSQGRRLLPPRRLELS